MVNHKRHLFDTTTRLAYDDAMQDAGPWFVGWGTLALINAGIAQGKNRSGLNWFLLSLLFGPIAAFFLVAFFPTRPPEVF